MKTQNNVMVLDTETVGSFGRPLIHDIGWKIVDKEFNTLQEVRYLVKEFHEEQQWVLNASDFYRTKHSLYKKAITDKEVELKPWKEIEKEMLSALRTYKVKVLSAYNLAFDYKALKYTNHFFNAENKKFMTVIDKKTFLCIWNLACDTILDTDDYRQYATMKNFISEKGNYLTNAESCYAYLIGNEDFEEEHTALADVQIEVEILKYIVTKCKGKVKYGLAYSCWQRVQK